MFGRSLHRRLHRRLRRALTNAAAIAMATGEIASAAAPFLVPAAPAAADPVAPTPRIVYGDSVRLSGANLSTFAKVLPQGRVTEVGLILPLAIVENPPALPGPGPDGQFVLNFPSVVQQSTFFNHLEFGWNPHGHEPEGVFDAPHFDFHFEGVPLQRILDIGLTFFDPVAPSPERIPLGYFYPGQDALVPFMGVHAFRPEDIVPSSQFTTIVLTGFHNDTFLFVEPMITQQFLLQRQSFSLNVPRPPVLGRSTLYPTRFKATYEKKSDTYYFVYSDFEAIQ